MKKYKRKLKPKTLCVDVTLNYLLKEKEITEDLYNEKINIITAQPSDPNAGVQPPEVLQSSNQDKLYVKKLDIGSMQVS